jgi:ATP-dependent DNA helicase DinG
MAEAVERALAEERVVLCEAGTGTGKTLAYLVPALTSGKKVVISTATRALQEQIFFKDLPLANRILGLPMQATLMKGLGNYLCRRRFDEFSRGEEALRPGVARAIDNVRAWMEETETGDLGELSSLREDDPVRLSIASSSETRLGQPCQHFDACFVTRMRREADAARIVIVNHHLFFADLALRGPHPGHVLPDYDAVIFDEAHQLEDVATAFFGVRVSEARLGRAMDDAERALRHAGALDALFARGAAAAVERGRHAVRDFFAELARGAPRGEPRLTLERDIWSGPAQARWHELDGAFEHLELEARAARDVAARSGASTPPGRARPGSASEALDATERRMTDLREQLGVIVDGGSGRVTWLELGPRGAALSSSPVDISFLLRQRVFETVPAIVLTSATLATRAVRPELAEAAAPAASPFGYIRSRLGLADDGVRVDELVVESPFDFERQALLYTPRDLPPPARADFVESAAGRVAELVRLVGGGAFVLTTSLRSMRAFHARLRGLIPQFRLLLQGDAPKATLLGAFRAAGDAVLVATTSFWEGVDVPGRALRLVVLEKVPFAVPTDPVVRARAEVLEREGKNPFLELHVPAAAIALKQGFGRLIRTRRDAGIVALLDERVHKKGYGRLLLDALPPAARTDDLGAVQSFWSGHTETSPKEPGQALLF